VIVETVTGLTRLWFALQASEGWAPCVRRMDRRPPNVGGGTEPMEDLGPDAGLAGGRASVSWVHYGAWHLPAATGMLRGNRGAPRAGRRSRLGREAGDHEQREQCP